MVCGQRIYFILFDHRFRSALPMQVLSDCFFYQAPVELETVQDGTLLGFTIDVVQRSVRYQVPPLWKIRDLRSAGSVRLRLSELKSRATLIRRYTFLEQFVRDDLDQLLTNSFSCMYRKGSPKQTANTSCTEGSSSIPKLLALESSYWYADEVANVPVRIFTNHLLMSCIYAIKGTQARLRAFLCVSSSVPKSSSPFVAGFN